MQTADAINLAIAVATFLSVVVSAAVAVMTYSILKANRAAVEAMHAQTDATSRPYLQVSAVARPMSTAIELHIRNDGATPASSVTLSLDKDFYFNAEPGDHNNLRRYNVFSRPIEMLPPRSELRFLLGIGHKILQNPTICPLQFSIKASYQYAGKSVMESTTIDLEPYIKANMPTDPIAERLDKVVAELKAFREQQRATDG